jgi:hypothetical protein
VVTKPDFSAAVIQGSFVLQLTIHFFHAIQLQAEEWIVRLMITPPGTKCINC